VHEQVAQNPECPTVHLARRYGPGLSTTERERAVHREGHQERRRRIQHAGASNKSQTRVRFLMRACVSRFALFAALIFIAWPAYSQELRVDLGVSLAIDAADGTPANDIPGAGILGRYALNDQWAVGVAVNRTEYDYEEPAAVLGIVQDPTMEVIDALAEATTVRAWIERSLTGEGRPMRFFLGAGVGAAFTDVPDVNGPRADGGTFDIRTQVDTEVIATVMGGARRIVGERWICEVAVRAEQHFADWRSTDRVSGAQGGVDDYLTWGIQFTLAYRW
jgi:hypothetical protein